MRGRERPEGEDILSLCARGCAALLLLVTHRFLAALHLWSQTWPLREILTQWVYQSSSLYHAPLHNIRMIKHQVSCFRMHSDLKGAVHWRMYVVIIYFYLVTGQIRFYCHYFVCETHTKKLAERPCYESAWWPRLLSSWKDGKSAPCDSWTIFETFWSLWWLYLMNRLNFSSWFTKKLSALVFVYILHVLCKLRENRWWQFSL